MRPGDGGPEERVRRAMERWPGDAVVVALVVPPGAGPGEFAAAASLADASAAGRRTLLADLSGREGLDAHLGVREERGLLQLGEEGLDLRDIARRPGGHGFVYLPAGRAAGASPADHAAILRLMARTADRIRERGGRLLLLFPAQEGWAEPLAGVLDGAVLLGDARLPADAPGELEVLAGIPGGAGEAREAAGRTGSEGWVRHRRSAGPPTSRIVVGGLVVAALVAGWWWLARRAAPEGREAASGVTAREVAGGASGSGAGTAEDGGPGPGQEAAPAPPERPEAGEVLAAAPELPYSVLIASYARWPQARRRLERWREPGGPVYFVAPTRVRGGLYWRLFAGALPDRASATALMERLVEEGRKDRVREWDVRPVELAFRVAVEASRDEAASRVEETAAGGVPAYVLPAAAGGDTLWQVYSGGFESGDAAADLERMLGESEVAAELVTRRGESGAE